MREELPPFLENDQFTFQEKKLHAIDVYEKIGNYIQFYPPTND